MYHRLITIILGFFLVIGTTKGGGYVEYTPEARQAYNYILSLRFKEARVALDWIRQNDTDNLVVHHLENYIDFFTIFINEEKEEFDQLEENKTNRLDALSRGSENSPYYLYVQADILLQWALVRLKFEEYVTAFNEISKAYKYLERNESLYPHFMPNKKSLGILHALLGTIPDSYKWGVKILGGMSGSIEQGRTEIEEVLAYAKRHDFMFEQETAVMYAWLLLHLKNEEDKAWQTVRAADLRPRSNPLACFTLANIAMRTGRNDEAIDILQNRPRGSKYHPFLYLEYMLGIAKLYRLDPDADEYIERYINYFRGQNYLKEAYQKLAWHFLLYGNTVGYHNNMRYCQIRGAAVIDGDKTALREAERNEIPDKTLLKARLLFDGGYYERAYALLSQKPTESYPLSRYRLEHIYRLARITHKMQRYEEALRYYQQTIDLGQDELYFYACNAALQMGILYEQMHQYNQAEAYYHLCLKMKPSEYRNSLHQKAKAGKNRLKSLSN